MKPGNQLKFLTHCQKNKENSPKLVEARIDGIKSFPVPLRQGIQFDI